MITETYINKRTTTQLERTDTRLATATRCPNCKARVAETAADCPLCGEALSPQILLRTQSNARVYTRQLAEASHAAPSTTDEASRVRRAQPPPEQPPAVAPPDSQPLRAPRPAGYKIGLLVGFSVAILGAALLIAVNLINQSTTEAQSLGSQAATPHVAVTLMAKPLAAASLGNVANLIVQRVEPTQAVIATLTPMLPKPAWDLALVSSHYESAGRPTQACSKFDSKDLVRKFTFTLNITNNTPVALPYKQWGMAALAGDQRAIKLCSVSAAGEALPNLPSGQTQQITLMAFVERNQQVTSILLGNATDVVGRVCVKDTVAVACP